ncbi:MAG TPA: carboxypeptidase-like regulatory domain-containing protein, partial [Lentisphaeria bacterium]|nr:carboxypeptidase-like regulatory domain-containing protein [Lentisphaeria bacterium]
RGHVIAGACYPGTDTKAKQQEFDVLSFGYRAGGNSYIFWNVTTDTPSNFSMTISNPNTNALTGIQASVALPDPELMLPVPALDSILTSFPDLPDTLAGGESIVINYSVTATAATPGRDYQRPLLRFTSAEGAELNIPIYFFAIPQFAKLSVNPVSIDTTMQIGVSRLVDVTISNTGAIETGPITITAPTLSWLTIASGTTMASIPAGGSATMSLQLRGDDNTALGMPLSGAIAINAANAQDGVRLPFRAMAVSEDKGSIRVSAVDEYTYFEEGNEPRLKNATVTVKNPYTGAILGSGNTGEDAFCIIENIPVGKALIVISADQHESATDIIDIAPGQQATVELFLSFQAISYKWDVVPTEIEDEYEVVLTVVYETNVPMPVVRTDMPTNFTDMLPGTTRMVNAVLTNEGLIAAHNVRLDFYNAGSFTFECTQPDDGQTLLPQQATVLPVIVRRAASATRAEDPCTTSSVTVYYYECGKDFKWHRYEKQMQLRICPPANWGGGGGGGGGFSPGVPYIGTAWVTQPSIPSLPSLPESCIPCQNGLLSSALKCGLGFLPIGCVLGVVDAIVSLVSNYDKGVEGWINIGTDGTLAGLGCVAEGTYGKFANILGCIRGFMSACDGLDGKPPTPWPVPGMGDGFTPSNTRGTRATGAPSWVEEAQDIAFIGYRQAGHHAAALIEYYGDDIWLEAENAQLSAFNKVFKQLTIAGPDGTAPVIAENAPELIAVLPDNVTLEDLAAFVARWNRTMAYWQSLPGGPGADLPGDTDGNGDPIISLAKLLGINNEIEQCEEDAKAAGYENVHELVRTQYAYTE